MPSPPTFGGQQRIHALARGLAEQHEVSVLSLIEPGEDATAAIAATSSYCKEVVTVAGARRAAGGIAKRFLQLGATISPWSYERIVHDVPALQIALDRMLARDRYDVVQLEFSHMGFYRVREHDGSRPVVCLDEHNIEYEICRRTARAATTALRRAYSAIDWRKVRAEELRAWKIADGCALTSERDERILHEQSPTTRAAVVPNGVDLDFFGPCETHAREPATFLFFGAIDYYPNTDGILYFVREIWPRVVARIPAARLCIVGRKPPDSVLALRGPQIEVTGAVDDIRPWLARATAIVVPLRIGGGTRLKILEAMAMGKAIVSTSLGAEGLDVKNERDILIADAAESFAHQMGRVVAEPDLGERIGVAGRRLVTARYGWKASVQRLSELHADLLETRVQR